MSALTPIFVADVEVTRDMCPQEIYIPAHLWGQPNNPAHAPQLVADRLAEHLGPLPNEQRAIYLEQPLGVGPEDTPLQIVERGEWSQVPMMAAYWHDCFVRLKKRLGRRNAIPLVICDYEYTINRYAMVDFQNKDWWAQLDASPAALAKLPAHLRDRKTRKPDAWDDWATGVRGFSMHVAFCEPFRQVFGRRCHFGNYGDSMGRFVDPYGRKDAQATVGTIDMPDCYLRVLGDPGAEGVDGLLQGYAFALRKFASVAKLAGRRAMPWISNIEYAEFAPDVPVAALRWAWTELTKTILAMRPAAIVAWNFARKPADLMSLAALARAAA